MGVCWDLLIVATAGGFVGTLVAIPQVKRAAHRFGFLDWPGGRKNHTAPVPLLGGVAIFAPLPVLFIILHKIGGGERLPSLEPRVTEFLSLFVATLAVVGLGLVDDKIPLGWKRKLIGQILAVLILIAGGHSLPSATVPFVGPVFFGWLGYVVFAVSVLTVTNAVNLIDGLDGLAGGICFFAASTWGIISLIKGDYSMAIVGLTLAGSLLGFLLFNFPPASIYMGDAGSLGLGFLLGALGTSATAFSSGQRPGTMGVALIPILPFGIALFDVAFSIVRRWISGKRIFLPDADHIHHRLMREFKRPRVVIAIIYSFTALLSAAAILLVMYPEFQSRQVFIAIGVGIFVIVIATILRLYRVRFFSDAVVNRHDVQFLEHFVVFMDKRMKRASSPEELISLLEGGVVHLGFDAVEVSNGYGNTKKWVNPTPVHPERARVRGERSLATNGWGVSWVIPIHYSPQYQEVLELSWQRVLKALALRLKELAEAPQHECSPVDLEAGKSPLESKCIPDSAK